MLSCRLEFECTNNIAEYEALVQGLYKAIGLKVQYLKLFGDSEIVIKQVRNTIHCLSNHLKHYQSLVQELIYHFLEFNISPIPRSQNVAADLLANVASKLLPSKDYSPDRFSVELIFRPSIPDNVTNWLLAGASNIPESGDTDHIEQINQISITNPKSQYANLIFYLKNGHAPPNLSYKNKWSIRLKAKNFIIIDDVLFRQNYDSVLLRCLEKPEAQKVLQELHDGPAGGHFGADTTAHKIIHVGYYWPTLFRDTHEYVRKCRSCQISSERQRKPTFPLQPVNIDQPFEQWGLDIIGEITPQSSKQHKYILTATNYFTKWVEAIPLKTTNSEGIIEFIDQFIITRIMQKASIGTSPFNIVYGKESVLSTNLALPSLNLVQFIEESPSSSIQLRHDQILKLEEEREKAKITHAKHQ
eukprot:PITA_30123